MPPQSEPSAAPRYGRLRSALRVLLGRTVTADDIRAEWLWYRDVLEDILTKWSARQAREAKAFKERLAAAAELDPSPPATDERQARKAEIVRLHSSRSMP